MNIVTNSANQPLRLEPSNLKKLRRISHQQLTQEKYSFLESMVKTHQDCIAQMHDIYKIEPQPPLPILTTSNPERKRGTYRQRAKDLSPLCIILKTAYPGWKMGDNKLRAQWYFDMKTAALHETGHYLHNIARPELYHGSYGWGLDDWLLREVGAEGANILYLEKSNQLHTAFIPEVIWGFPIKAIWRFWQEEKSIFQHY